MSLSDEAIVRLQKENDELKKRIAASESPSEVKKWKDIADSYYTVNGKYKKRINELLDQLKLSGIPVSKENYFLDESPESPSKGMKWVKAIERLPENKGTYITKYPALASEKWIVKDVPFNPALDDTYIHNWKNYELEWLDEGGVI